MLISVRTGAVIRLLMNFQSNRCFEGAVVGIDKERNQIELQPQLLVARRYVRRDSGFISGQHIREDMTVDANIPSMHIDKSAVIGWEYVSSYADPATSYSGYLTSEQADEEGYVRRRYSNGVCYGEGELLE